MAGGGDKLRVYTYCRAISSALTSSLLAKYSCNIFFRLLVSLKSICCLLFSETECRRKRLSLLLDWVLCERPPGKMSACVTDLVVVQGGCKNASPILAQNASCDTRITHWKVLSSIIRYTIEIRSGDRKESCTDAGVAMRRRMSVS